MATKTIIDTAKELLEEKIASYVEPSEKKVAAAKRKVEAAKQNLKTAEQKVKDADEQWKKFKKEFEGRINSNKASINNFRKKMNKSGVKVKSKYQEKLDELEQKNKKMMVKMGKYKDERAEKWEAFKSVFKKDVEEIGSSLQDLTRTLLND